MQTDFLPVDSRPTQQLEGKINNCSDYYLGITKLYATVECQNAYTWKYTVPTDLFL